MRTLQGEVRHSPWYLVHWDAKTSIIKINNVEDTNYLNFVPEASASLPLSSFTDRLSKCVGLICCEKGYRGRFLRAGAREAIFSWLSTCHGDILDIHTIV